MAIKDTTTKDPDAKRAAITLVSKGLITRAEAAKMAGISRQLMRLWLGDIPADRNRQAVVTKLWRAAIRRARKISL